MNNKTVNKKTIPLPDVEWVKIGNNDFSCVIGKYHLRVEKMDRNYWWWCVYYENDYAGFNEPQAKTEKEAKNAATICFHLHLQGVHTWD